MTDEKFVETASEEKPDEICEAEADAEQELEQDYDDVEILQAAVDRKIGEIAELKNKRSRARSDANKKKYGDLISFLVSDIVGYRTVISDLTDTECDLSDLEYDPDQIPDYDSEEIYNEYLKGLNEKDRDAETLADSIRNDYCDDILEDVFYAVGMKILSSEELLDAVADCDFVVTELGRAAVMEDSLYDLIFTDAEGDEEEDDGTPYRKDVKKSKKKNMKKSGKKDAKKSGKKGKKKKK
ncbi:MAG: hypothetical protein PWR17_281 [Candidatus Methanomethylophilaceae archaeon]|nr:hypothetical protein [Candidatus Methanomethylophilaceae archaeon]